MLWSANVPSLLETCYVDLIQYLDTYWKMCFGYVAKIYSQLLLCLLRTFLPSSKIIFSPH